MGSQGFSGNRQEVFFSAGDRCITGAGVRPNRNAPSPQEAWPIQPEKGDGTSGYGRGSDIGSQPFNRDSWQQPQEG